MIKAITVMAAGVLVAGGTGLAVTAHHGTTVTPQGHNVVLSANAKATTGKAGWAGHRGGFGGGMNVMANAAKALNVSQSTLQADMKDGKSLADIAVAQGSTAAALESTLLTDAQAQLASAVSAGKMTAAQETSMSANLSKMIDQMVTQVGGMFKGGAPGGFGGGMNVMANAAKALNISQSTLQTDMKAGKSLADIAVAQGSTAAALESTLLTDAQTQMASAVSAGKMTAAQETSMSANLSKMIDQMVTHAGGTFKGGAHGGFGGGMNVMANAAKALNISQSTLQTDMKAGKSLADIAVAQGSTAAALESTLLTDAQAQLASAVSAGKMTAAQESAMSSHLSTMIDQMVTHSGHMQGGWGHKAPAASSTAS